MISKVVASLQSGMAEGIRVANDTVDDVVYGDPEEQMDKILYDEAEKRVEAENSRIDEMNAKIDAKVEAMQEKVDNFNEAFDRGVQKGKETIKRASQSDLGVALRTVNAVRGGKAVLNYIKENPEFVSDLKEKFINGAKSVATRLQEQGITPELVDDDPEREDTEQICARRNALFGAPDAGVMPPVVPDTELLLSGMEVPTLDIGLEMAMG